MNNNHNYHAIHFPGHSEQEGGTFKMENEFTGTIRCFVCGKHVDPEEIVVMSFNEDDMVCVCKVHIKYAYPELASNYPVPNVEGTV